MNLCVLKIHEDFTTKIPAHILLRGYEAIKWLAGLHSVYSMAYTTHSSEEILVFSDCFGYVGRLNLLLHLYMYDGGR